MLCFSLFSLIIGCSFSKFHLYVTFMLVPFRCPRLKPKNIEKVLQEYGNRARKLEGQKLDLDDFAQFLDVPVSDMLRDMFALFDEVKVSLTTIIKFSEFLLHHNITCFNPLLFIQQYICIYYPQKNHHHFIAAFYGLRERAAASFVKKKTWPCSHPIFCLPLFCFVFFSMKITAWISESMW